MPARARRDHAREVAVRARRSSGMRAAALEDDLDAPAPGAQTRKVHAAGQRSRRRSGRRRAMGNRMARARGLVGLAAVGTDLQAHDLRPRPRAHVALAAHEVLQRHAAEHAVDGVLEQAPHRTDGAVADVGAEAGAAGVECRRRRSRRAARPERPASSPTLICSAEGRQRGSRRPCPACSSPGPPCAAPLIFSATLATQMPSVPAQLGDGEARALRAAGPSRSRQRRPYSSWVLIFIKKKKKKKKKKKNLTSAPAGDARRPTSWSGPTAGRAGPARRPPSPRGWSAPCARCRPSGMSPIPQPGAVSVKRTSTFWPPSSTGGFTPRVWDEAELDDVHRDLGVVAGAELVPDPSGPRFLLSRPRLRWVLLLRLLADGVSRPRRRGRTM